MRNAMKIVASLLLLIISTTTLGGQTSNRQVKDPVSAEGLVRLLVERIPLSDIIRTIKERGVGFQALQPIEDEIREAGKYLSVQEIDSLLSVTRDYFRPPANPPYRVTYMSLKGVAVNLLLDRRVDKEWDEILGTRKYFIVPNDILKSLKRLMAKFSSAGFGQEYFANEPETTDDLHENRKLARFYRIKKKPLFVGTLGEPTGDGEPSVPDTDYVSVLVRSLNDPSEEWRVIQVQHNEVVTQRGEPPRDLYTFRKFLERGELNLFRPSKLAAFYSHITRNHLPPDFAAIELAVERVEGELVEAGCDEVRIGKPQLETSAVLIGPLLILNVAVLENVSDKPISTGRFFIRSNNVEILRTREQDRASLNSAQFQKLDLFTSRVLKPGEKLVIPIDLSMMRDDWEETWTTAAVSADESEDFVC
jgi:hypothetical protein